jgi:hypothetical protein
MGDASPTLNRSCLGIPAGLALFALLASAASDVVAQSCRLAVGVRLTL